MQMMQVVGREAPSPALQLWEAYHSSSALAGTLRGAVRAHQQCEHLAQLLDTVSELLCFVFSRFNDALFLGSLNTHVASAAQLLHFGLLKVCRVADSCCGGIGSSSTAPFSPASTTSSAASAAADIQLAVTVLATAVQYLETTHSTKHSDAAAPKVLPGPRASLQLQQQAILQSSKDAAAASRASARRSTGSTRQLSEQLDAVQLFNSAAEEGTAGLAGKRYSSRHSASSAYSHNEQQENELDDAAQPAVAVEITFDEQWPLQTPEDVSASSTQKAGPQQQEQQAGPPAVASAPESAATAASAADAIDPEAYQAAKLQALQELLQPGTTWSLEEGGAGFVCKPSTSCSSSPQQQQQQQSPVASPAKLHAVQQANQQHAALPDTQGNEQLDAGLDEPSPSPAVAGEAEDAELTDSPADALPAAMLEAAAQTASSESFLEDCSTADVCAGDGDKTEPLQQENSLQEHGLQEADAAVSSTAWLQQQLQQIYSNTLLQGRKPQQQRHSMLRCSQELMCGVVDAAELPLLPARAQSPEPAGLGVGFVAAGFNSSSGSGGRSVRASTEDLVEAVLGRRARTTDGCTGSTVGSMYGSSRAAAAAAGVVSAVYEPAGRAAGAGGAAASPSRGRRLPFSSAPGSTRVSVDVTAAGYDSRGRSSNGGGMVGTCSPRGYAGRSYASRAASVTGSVRSSNGAGAAGSQRRGSSSSPGSAARGVSGSGSGRVTPTRPASVTAGGVTTTARSGRVTPAKTDRDSSPCVAAAQSPSAAGQRGSSSGSDSGSQGQTRESNRVGSSCPGQARMRASGEWQDLPAAASPSGAAGGRSPSRTGSPSPARQSQNGVRVSRDSILSNSRSSIPGASSNSSAGRTAYEEALAAATASAAGTVYKSATSSGSGSISGTGGLTRRSSAGSTTLFISARSSHAGSTAGSVISCHEGTGRMRTSSTGGAGTCSVTSAAGVSVLGMLAAAAAGAAGEAAAAGLGQGVVLNTRSMRNGSRKGSNQGESWLEPAASMQQLQQLAGSMSAMPVRCSRSGSTPVGSGMAGQLSISAAEDGLVPDGISLTTEAGSQDPLVTGMGCLTLGSCSGGRSGRASLASGGGSAAMTESVRLSRCSLTGVAQQTGGGSRQVSGELASMQQQEAGVGSRSGSSAGCRVSGSASACSFTGELDVTRSTGSQVADDEGLQDEQQQQHKEVLDFLAAARQDTKQGRKSAGSGGGDFAAAVSSAADALAAGQTLPVSPAQQEQQRSSVAQQSEDKQQSCSSVTSDGMAAGVTDGKGAAAWQEQQGQWQQQWQQQQQVWQQQGEQQQPDVSAAGTESQQQVEEEFSLCPSAKPAAGARQAAAAEDQQQQVHGDNATSDTESRVVTHSAARGDSPAASPDANCCSTPAADSDDFGDFQDSPHATSAGGYFGDSTDAAATEGTAGDASTELAAAVAEQSDRSSLMVHSTASQQHLAPADPAAAATPPAAAVASSAAASAKTPEAAAEALLAQGNTAYTAGKYSPAVQCYAKALDSLGGSIAQTSSEAGVLLWIKCSLNLACCHLRLGQFKQCVALCDGLLEVDPANIVALCHRGRALLMVQQHAAAKDDLTAALELLEEEAAEQMQQQQTYIGQQQPSSQTAAVGKGTVGREAAAAKGGDAVLGPLQAADGVAVGGAVRPSSRCLSPCTLARMRLNNGYWQQRVVGLLASIKES